MWASGPAVLVVAGPGSYVNSQKAAKAVRKGRMSVTRTIVASWRRPREVVRGLLARGRSEPFAFTLLVTFLILAFVARWPSAARIAHVEPEKLLLPQLLALALALLATIPVWYGLAALSRIVSGVFGGQGSWYGARLALFWALVAVSPLVLLHGLIAGMLGSGEQATALGVLVGVGFMFQWINALIVVEGPQGATEQS